MSKISKFTIRISVQSVQQFQILAKLVPLYDHPEHIRISLNLKSLFGQFIDTH